MGRGEREAVNRRSKILCAFGLIFLFAAFGIYLKMAMAVVFYHGGLGLPPPPFDDPKMGVTYETVQWWTGVGLLGSAFFLLGIVSFLTGIVRHFRSSKRVS
jgi:hypothetical protein